MRNIVVFLFILSLPFDGSAGSRVQDTKRKLKAPEEIQGYSCAKGWAWFYLDNSTLERCTVSRDTAFGEATVPQGSIIALRKDGKPDHVFLSHDTSIAGVSCKGGSLLGPSEGSVTSFFPSGKLKLCWLVADQEIQGVPCMGAAGPVGAVLHHGGAEARFYENGKLHSCTLSDDHGDQKRGDRFFQNK